MKKNVLLFLSLCLTSLLQANVVKKTVTVTSAGTLTTLLTEKEKHQITDLTINGTINAKDFYLMRDSMPELSKLDIREVKITSIELKKIINVDNAIPNFAFCNPQKYTGKSSLTSILLPASITQIHENAFEGCSGLTTITIPASVTIVEDYAFSNCKNLSTVYVNLLIPFDLRFSVFYIAQKPVRTLYIPKGSKDAYQKAVNWKDFDNFVEQ